MAASVEPQNDSVTRQEEELHTASVGDAKLALAESPPISGLSSVPSCSTDATLSDVAEQLLSTGHTAAILVDKASLTQGVITEDDILQGYLQGAPWDVTVAEWIRGGGGAPISGSSAPPTERGASSQDFSRVVPSLAWMEGLAPQQQWEASVKVEDFMEPVSAFPSLSPSCTVQQLLHELRASSSRAVVVNGDEGVLGLLTAQDALWAFQQRLCRSEGAWRHMSWHRKLHCHSISSDATAKAAAARLASAFIAKDSKEYQLRNLLVVSPGSTDVVGVLSVAQLVRGRPPDVQTVTHPGSEATIGRRVCSEANAEESHPRAKRRRVARHHHVTVKDIAAKRETATCSLADSLQEVAERMVSAGRTAAVVLDARGDVRGVLTGNDLMAALQHRTCWNVSVDDWLRGEESRLPGFMVPVLTLPAKATLAQAAATMASFAEQWQEEKRGFSSHHLLVCDDRADRAAAGRVHHCWLLSDLDIAKGILEAALAEAAGASESPSSCAIRETASMTVREAMKKRSSVRSCNSDEHLSDAFRSMFDSKQNSVLVVSERVGLANADEAHSKAELEARQSSDGSSVQGIITATDAVVAFSARQRGATTLSGWLEWVGGAQKSIPATALLADAAKTMAEAGVHHLMVSESGSGTGAAAIVGVLSALDIVRALGANYMFF